MLALDAVSLLILAGATWRLAALFSYERGPWSIFLALRTTAGIGHDHEGTPTFWPPTFIAGLLGCVWCLSMWIGLLLTLTYIIWQPSLWIWTPFALSAAAILIERVAR